MRRCWLALACLVGGLLASCGGGGAGGGSDNSWLSFAPATISVTTYQGESASFSVTAHSSKTIAEVINVGIIDKNGVTSGQVTIGTVNPTTYVATMSTSAALPPGTHTGSLEIRICLDSPLTCQKPYPGSPWQLPYTIVVKAGTNLTPLAKLASAPVWSTYQGNAAHTGYVPATVSASAFSRRWAWTVPPATATRTLTSVTAEGDRVFGVGHTDSGWAVYALSEVDGHLLWSYPMGPLSNVNPPAVSGGKVYVTSTGHADTFMWMFDATTGQLLAKQPMSSQWESYLAPTVFGGAVYTETGSYGGMARFDAATGTASWVSGLQQYDSWSPALDSQYAYAYAGSELAVLDALTGARAFTIADPRFEWSAYSVRGAPVLDGNGTVYATQYGIMNGALGPDGRLLAFDTVARTLKWDLAAHYRSNPALANGVLYVVNGLAFEARATADGSLLWAWTPPEGFDAKYLSLNQVVVVGNVAFVTTATSTHAIDLGTHQSVWSYPATGSIAVSDNGLLYIAVPNGSLVAINLH